MNTSWPENHWASWTVNSGALLGSTKELLLLLLPYPLWILLALSAGPPSQVATAPSCAVWPSHQTTRPAFVSPWDRTAVVGQVSTMYLAHSTYSIKIWLMNYLSSSRNIMSKNERLCWRKKKNPKTKSIQTKIYANNLGIFRRQLMMKMIMSKNKQSNDKNTIAKMLLILSGQYRLRKSPFIFLSRLEIPALSSAPWLQGSI